MPSAWSSVILANVGSISSGADISTGHKEIPNASAAASWDLIMRSLNGVEKTMFQSNSFVVDISEFVERFHQNAQSTPTTGTLFDDCCARAESGNAAAASMMNCRRLMGFPS
jgi:hypothetical protein